MKCQTTSAWAILVCLVVGGAAAAQDKANVPGRFTHQVTGLFSPEREPDLRKACESIPDIKLIGIDFKNAEVILEYVPAKVLANVKPDQVVAKLDGLLKSASNHTFGVKLRRTAPLDKLKLIEIPVAGLDCKACCLAAYEAIYRIDGVERATASFRDRLVTALIDPEKTNRAALQAALKQRGVDIIGVPK